MLLRHPHSPVVVGTSHAGVVRVVWALSGLFGWCSVVRMRTLPPVWVVSGQCLPIVGFL